MVSGNVPAARPPGIAAGAGPTDEPSLPRDFAELSPIADAKSARVPSGVLQRSSDTDRDQCQDLVSVYQKEQTLKACLDNCTGCSKFADVWHLLGEKFTPLRDFAGGLGTVSPSTATVESDFSLCRRRASLEAQTDFSLEGILHYKQYEAILKHK
jgi:hypothetical protein